MSVCVSENHSHSMRSTLAQKNKIKTINKIFHRSLCIEFNCDCGISPTEFKVISLLLEGYNSRQIADICSRSIKTISTQKRSAFRRMGIRNDASLLSTLLLHDIVTIYIDLSGE